ncbi:MAG: hypothetical protein EOM92_09955 [Gammaproteobacteria bacterium]|jgi:hypothetical protein|nr:hypothetical protein [Gammaproteobacteria bacterium]
MTDTDTGIDNSEKTELARYQREIVKDLQKMVDHYLRTIEWDVPDIDDEQHARGLVMQALKSALAEIEADQK